MKKTLLALSMACIAALSLTSCGNVANQKLADEQDSLSWAMGMSLAQTLQSDFYPFDQKIASKTFYSMMDGEESPLTEKRFMATSQDISFLFGCTPEQRKMIFDKKGAPDKEEITLFSQVMGISLAKTAQSGFYEFDNDLLIKAFKSSLKGKKQPLDENSYKTLCQKMTELTVTRQAEMAEHADKKATIKEQEYLDQLVKDNPNVKKSDEGFFYEVLTEGNGPQAKAGLRVKFDFKETNMLTGEVITQTYGEREPIVHVVSPSMFKGLYDGLQMMKAGSHYRFYFPHKLVQGAIGTPANTPVTYEVELHEIYND